MPTVHSSTLDCSYSAHSGWHTELSIPSNIHIHRQGAAGVVNVFLWVLVCVCGCVCGGCASPCCKTTNNVHKLFHTGSDTVVRLRRPGFAQRRTTGWKCTGHQMYNQREVMNACAHPCTLGSIDLGYTGQTAAAAIQHRTGTECRSVHSITKPKLIRSCWILFSRTPTEMDTTGYTDAGCGWGCAVAVHMLTQCAFT